MPYEWRQTEADFFQYVKDDDARKIVGIVYQTGAGWVGEFLTRAGAWEGRDNLPSQQVAKLVVRGMIELLDVQ